MSCSAPMGGKRRGGNNEEPVTDKSMEVPKTPVPAKSPEKKPKTPETPKQLEFDGGRKILRRGYTAHRRGKTIRVKSKRIRDMGAPGKWKSLHGPGIGELKPGGLMGYTPAASKTARHKSLRKAVKKTGPLSTFRKLNALSTYTKRTSKTKSRTAKTDRNWVKKTFM